MDTNKIKHTLRLVPNVTRLASLLPAVGTAATTRPVRPKTDSSAELAPLFVEEEQGELLAGCPYTCGGSCGFTDNC